MSSKAFWRNVRNSVKASERERNLEPDDPFDSDGRSLRSSEKRL